MLATSFVFSASQRASAAVSEAYNWNNVVTGGGGGYVPGIIFNKKEKDLIYARTDIGGAYRWNKSTNGWDSITDSAGWVDWNKNGVDALATDSVDPNRLYLATGMYTNDWDGNGQIMRSTDRGNTWAVTSLPFKVGGNMPGRGMGERLVIDPNKNSVLFYGARSGNGLWKSTDYGVTWSKVTSFTNAGTYIQTPGDVYGGDIVGLSWITFDPSTGTSGNATQTIYVGVADKGTSVYKSTDGGTTWAAVAGQPTGYIPHHGELASNGNLYITYSDGAGPYDGTKGDVWKLNTATGAWTNISPVPSSNTSDNYFGYGGISVDAQNPNTLIVAALNMWWPDGQIYRSRDGGATWSTFWVWGNYPNRTLNYTHDITGAPWLDMGVTASMPDVSPKLGWMMDDIEIDPFNSDRMMYGTGATIYGTTNLTALDTGGKVKLSVMAKGIEETAVLGLISPPSGAPLISALGDIAGFRHDSLTTPPTKVFTSPHWSTTYGIDYAELTPSYIVRVGMADYEADATVKSVAISTDGGTNWYKTNSEPSGTTGGGTVAVAADASSIVWSTSDKGVYYSKTGGNSWTASTGVPAGAKVASDRVNPNKIYAYAAGALYLSKNGGVSFAQTAATGLPLSGSANLKAVPGIEGDIWFAGGNDNPGPYGLWHSTNSGASFTKLSNVTEADGIGFGKAAAGSSYMALYTIAKIDGVRGIFRSNDAGATWVRINDDQHQYGRPTVITGDPRIYGRVYLGTNGRGILYADPTGGTTTPVNSTITPTTASFNKKTANQADIAVTMTLNGNTLSNIKNGSATLVSGTDYTVSGSAVTIKKSYLASQAVGTTTLTFNFSAGSAATLAVTVVDTTSTVSNSTITPTTASFDKKTANQADIAVTMTLNGNTLSNIKNGSATLISGTDYTVSGSAVTIKKSYLAAQAVGTTTLTFNFSAGSAATLAVTVTDTTSAATGTFKVQAFNGSTSASAVSINPRIRITNTGTTALNLADVKVRYYYTSNGTQSQVYAIDWASIGSANITGTFVTMPTAKTNADTYLEIGFTSAAGTVAAGQSVDIQIRFNKSDWSNYTQTDDYSYNSTSTAYVDWTKTTGYTSGTLTWGIEP
ncbi:X2-like carbohydrate binding domain-containing protein [Paenibacillus sp. CCS19]|uniref:X2-like carbohydrate binding domain-containing protein n=1 Tax=Paenibacillus sp. CCS19 TaxID=3158387 RepID=UPI00295F0506|nr:X2-like carbohydrate binding domain-containing protein [Paenibacillus cellulosilyticus]